MSYDLGKIKERICGSLEKETDIPKPKIDELAFHMTDWLQDLSRLNEFYDDPSKLQDKEVYDILLKYLIHVPEHIGAAAKIMTGFSIENIFDDEK